MTYSAGWNLRHATEAHVNNAGYVNDSDYDADLDSPLVAVIGDSYVEALIVPHPRTLQGCLAQWLEGRGRVYSFAASGAPLSQYLAWAEFVAEEYRPDHVIFVVVGNDFDESLARYKRGPGFHHFFERDGELVLELVPYEPSPLRELVYASALARYLVFNLNVTAAWQQWKNRKEQGADGTSAEQPAYVANTEAGASKERVEASRMAVDSFFSELGGLGAWRPDQVTFVVDAIRPFVYDGKNAEAIRASFASQMRDYLMLRGRELGYNVIDMHPIFERIHRREGLVFEFDDDSHWNEHGHRVAAQAVAGLPVFAPLFGFSPEELGRAIEHGCGRAEAPRSS